MKKNIFDPFMQINLENAIKEAKATEILRDSVELYDNNDALFMDKQISFRTPQIVPGFVILITSQSMGINNEVGSILLKDFLTEVLSLADLPEDIVFVNEGVKVVEGNLSLVKKMKKYGIKIVVCNESLKFFNIQNTFDFAYKLSSSDIAKRLLTAKRFLKM